MQFRALGPGIQLPAEEKNYVEVASVKCPNCPYTYRLFAPILETEQSEVEAQKKWLLGYAAKHCGDHADCIRTPDRPR